MELASAPDTLETSKVVGTSIVVVIKEKLEAELPDELVIWSVVVTSSVVGGDAGDRMVVTLAVTGTSRIVTGDGVPEMVVVLTVVDEGSTIRSKVMAGMMLVSGTADVTAGMISVTGRVEVTDGITLVTSITLVTAGTSVEVGIT